MCSKLVETLMALVTLVGSVQGHGRLVEPPSRSTMWRYGYDTPVNYLDHQLFCGGYTVQWEKNKGKCGVCGDAWDGPRDNEAGGKYAKGVIVRKYKTGSSIHVIVDLTAPHKGYFEFRLCPNNNPAKAVTPECLDQHLLPLADGSGTKFYITSAKPQKYQLVLQLPAGLECSQCVLQWKYNAGNNWGVDENGRGCVGCGAQEQFYACADIAVGNMAHFVTEPSSTTTTPHMDRVTDAMLLRKILSTTPSPFNIKGKLPNEKEEKPPEGKIGSEADRMEPEVSKALIKWILHALSSRISAKEIVALNDVPSHRNDKEEIKNERLLTVPSEVNSFFEVMKKNQTENAKSTPNLVPNSEHLPVNQSGPYTLTEKPTVRVSLKDSNKHELLKAHHEHTKSRETTIHKAHLTTMDAKHVSSQASTRATTARKPFSTTLSGNTHPHKTSSHNSNTVSPDLMSSVTHSRVNSGLTYTTTRGIPSEKSSKQGKGSTHHDMHTSKPKQGDTKGYSDLTRALISKLRGEDHSSSPCTLSALLAILSSIGDQAQPDVPLNTFLESLSTAEDILLRLNASQKATHNKHGVKGNGLFTGTENSQEETQTVETLTSHSRLPSINTYTPKYTDDSRLGTLIVDFSSRPPFSIGAVTETDMLTPSKITSRVLPFDNVRSHTISAIEGKEALEKIANTPFEALDHELQQVHYDKASRTDMILPSSTNTPKRSHTSTEYQMRQKLKHSTLSIQWTTPSHIMKPEVGGSLSKVSKSHNLEAETPSMKTLKQKLESKKQENISGFSQSAKGKQEHRDTLFSEKSLPDDFYPTESSGVQDFPNESSGVKDFPGNTQFQTQSKLINNYKTTTGSLSSDSDQVSRFLDTSKHTKTIHVDRFSPGILKDLLSMSKEVTKSPLSTRKSTHSSRSRTNEHYSKDQTITIPKAQNSVIDHQTRMAPSETYDNKKSSSFRYTPSLPNESTMTTKLLPARSPAGTQKHDWSPGYETTSREYFQKPFNKPVNLEQNGAGYLQQAGDNSNYNPHRRSPGPQSGSRSRPRFDPDMKTFTKSTLSPHLRNLGHSGINPKERRSTTFWSTVKTPTAGGTTLWSATKTSKERGNPMWTSTKTSMPDAKEGRGIYWTKTKNPTPRWTSLLSSTKAPMGRGTTWRGTPKTNRASWSPTGTHVTQVPTVEVLKAIIANSTKAMIDTITERLQATPAWSSTKTTTKDMTGTARVTPYGSQPSKVTRYTHRPYDSTHERIHVTHKPSSNNVFKHRGVDISIRRRTDQKLPSQPQQSRKFQEHTHPLLREVKDHRVGFKNLASVSSEKEDHSCCSKYRKSSSRLRDKSARENKKYVSRIKLNLWKKMMKARLSQISGRNQVHLEGTTQPSILVRV